MMRFRLPLTTGLLLGCVAIGCQSPSAQTFWRGPLLQGFDNAQPQTYQKPPSDSGGLTSKAPPKDTEVEPPEKKTGPTFPEKTPAKLTLAVTAPARVQQGSRVTFDSVITNSGGTAATDVVIESRYGSVFEFPKRDAESAHQTIGVIGPGESRRLALSLKAPKTGNHCVEFSVKMADREVVWKSVCVEVEQPRYQLQLAAPPKRLIGDRIEVTALLANQSKDDLKGVTVTMRFDGGLLSPFEASTGVKQEDGLLTWTVNKLNAGSGVPLQAEFVCRKAAAETCVIVNVTTDDAAAESRQLCFAIATPSTAFDMKLSDTADLLAVGDETEVLTKVSNRTTRSVAGEPLIVIVPDNCRVVSTSVERAGKPLAVKFEVKDGRVLFESLPMIPPGDELTYRVKLKALRAGQSVVQSQLGPKNKPLLQLSEPITVN